MSRVLERYAHHFLALIGISLLSMMLFIAGYLGLFGKELKSTIEGPAGQFWNWLWSDPVEKSAKLLGALGTILGAAYSITKGIYFAKVNLPKRLTELIDNTTVLLAVKRSQARRLLEQARYNLEVGEVSLYVGPMNRAFINLGLKKISSSFDELGKVIDAVAAEKTVIKAKQKSLHAQLATAHVLRGVILMSDAERNGKDVGLRRKGLGEALREFEAALEALPDDTDALELKAEILLELGRREDAWNCLIDLSEAVDAQANTSEDGAHKWLQGARAYRRLGDFEKERGRQSGVRGALVNARSEYYDAGIKLLTTKRQHVHLDEGETLELARLYLATIELFELLEQPVNRATYRVAGINCLHGLNSPEANLIRNGFGAS